MGEVNESAVAHGIRYYPPTTSTMLRMCSSESDYQYSCRHRQNDGYISTTSSTKEVQAKSDDLQFMTTYDVPRKLQNNSMTKIDHSVKNTLSLATTYQSPFVCIDGADKKVYGIIPA